MRAALLALDAIAAVAMAAAVLVLLTGGIALGEGAQAVRVHGISNPLTFALAAAGLRRLLGPPGEPDAVSRAAAWTAQKLGAVFGRRGERLTGVLVFRLDAVLIALYAANALSRGIAEPVRVDGDGVGYYGYVRSVMIDRDLDFLDEYRDFNPRQQWVNKRTPIGRVENPFSIGPALLWAPFFAVGGVAAAAADASGFAVAPSGYSPPFVYACAAATWLAGVAGIVLLYRLLLVHHGRSVALAALAATVLTSPLAYYFPYVFFYSHTQSFFAVTLFLLLWARTPAQASRARWLVLGLAGALVALMRWQDAVLWSLPALTLLGALVRRRKHDAGGEPASAALLGKGLACLVGFAAGVLPQLVVFRLLNGFWLGVPQGTGFVALLPLWIGPTLFSMYHGFYPWSPLLLVATLGLVVAAVAGRPWARAFLAGLVLEAYANGCIWQWWAGHSYGARRFVSALPFLAFGFAEVFRRLRARRAAWVAGLAVVALFALWNHLLILQWNAGTLPHEAPLDVGAAAAEAWRQLGTFTASDVLGEDTPWAILLRRLADLVGDRAPFLAAAAALYALALRRSRAPRPRAG